MHIERVDAQVIGCQIYTCEDFGKGEMLSVSEQDDFIGKLLHLTLDKPQKVLLIHASRMMNMCVHFSNVVKVAMRHLLGISCLLILVQKYV